MASRVTQNTRLPVLAKNRTMKPKGGGRAVLGDITSRQNVAQPSEGKGKVAVPEGKQRVTRLAARKLAQVEQVLVAKVEDRSLPAGVEDIDRLDSDPQLCAEYAADMFAYLRGRQRTVAPLHLQGCPTNDRMRAVLVDWLVEVQVQFKLLQETLFSTVSIVDRYLAVEGKHVTKSQLQLVGVSAMFLAAKTEEVYAPACSDFVYITDNAYTEAQIKATEIAILRVLNFDLFEPVSLHFLRRFSKAGDVDVLQHGLAKFAIEAALLEYQLVPVEADRLAAAALLLALLLLGKDQAGVWGPNLAHHTTFTRDQLLPTTARLARLLANLLAKGSKLQATKIKYQGNKFHKVADLPELRGEVMARLIALKL